VSRARTARERKKPTRERKPRTVNKPAATAKPPKPSDIPGPPPESLAKLGEASSDPLEANAQMHAALVASFFDAAKDPELSARDRRLEMRTISAAAAKLIPNTRLYEAERLIKSDHAELAKKKERRAAGKLQPRAPR
jgi:hypothetical protein